MLLAGIALWGIGRSLAGRGLNRTFVIAAFIAELELIGQALIATIIVIRGHSTASLPEFIGYATSSVILIPIALERTRGVEPSRWDPAIVGAVCAALAIAVLRLLVLWEPG